METLLQLMANGDLFQKYIQFIKADFFESTEEVYVFQNIKEFYDEFKKIPKYSELQHMLYDTGITINKPAEFWTNEYLDNVLDSFVRDGSIEYAVERFIEYRERGKSSAGAKLVTEAVNIDIDDSISTSAYDLDDVWEDLTKESKKLPTGWETLDTMLEGGVNIPSYNYFIGKSGFGKSLSLINLSRSCIEQGYDVLYITLELDEVTILKRYYQHAYKINKMDGHKEVIRDGLIKDVKNNKGEFSTEYFQPGVLTPHRLETLLRKYTQKKRKTPIIMLDYAGLMKPNDFYPQMPSFEKDKAISEEVRGIASMFDTVIWTVEQFNRTAAGENDEPTEENIQGGISKIQTCDNMFAMIPKSKNMDTSIITCKVFKSRNAPCAGKYFRWNVDWSTLTFKDWDPNKAGGSNDFSLEKNKETGKSDHSLVKKGPKKNLRRPSRQKVNKRL